MATSLLWLHTLVGETAAPLTSSLTNAGQETAAKNLSDVTAELVRKAAADALPSTLGFAGALIVFALVAHFLLELRKVQTGQSPDYAKAVAVVFVHVLLLTQYPAFSDFVLSMGAGVTRGGQVTVDAQAPQAHALAARFARFQKGVNGKVTTRALEEAALPATGNDVADNALQTAKDVASSVVNAVTPNFATLSPSVFIDRLFEDAADILMSLIFVATSALVLFLSVIQKAALVLLVAAGPILVVLSAFPGPTSGFLFSWVLSVFEVSMWGFTTRILSSLLSARFASGVPESVTGGDAGAAFTAGAGHFTAYFENVAFCAVLAGAYAMVPVLTSGLFRGSLASQGGQMLGQATGFATGVVTGRLGGATGSGVGASSGGAGEKSGAPGGTARAGDEGVTTPASPAVSSSPTRGQYIAKARAIRNNQSRAGD